MQIFQTLKKNITIHDYSIIHLAARTFNNNEKSNKVSDVERYKKRVIDFIKCCFLAKLG